MSFESSLTWRQKAEIVFSVSILCVTGVSEVCAYSLRQLQDIQTSCTYCEAQLLTWPQCYSSEYRQVILPTQGSSHVSHKENSLWFQWTLARPYTHARYLLFCFVSLDFFFALCHVYAHTLKIEHFISLFCFWSYELEINASYIDIQIYTIQPLCLSAGVEDADF